MRDFSWKYFMMTGDLDAYLLFKEIDGNQESEHLEEDEPIQEDVLEP